MPRRPPRTVIPHVELHTSQRTGAVVRVACTCPLAADHTHEDWVAQLADRRRVR